MSHPNAIDLEALALGDSPRGGETALHVETCEACKTYVNRVRDVSAETSPSEAVGGSASDDRARARIAELTRTTSKPPIRSIAPVVAMFALAAAVLLWIARPRPAEITTSPVTPATPAMLDAALAMNDPPAREPDVRFKGGLSLAVVRERHGDQTRFTERVAIQPGDRLRLEVALDQTGVILAGVLGEDGSWLELMPEGTRDAGTHLSERSARVDETPTRGLVVVGSPEDVRRARATRDMTGLTTFDVEVESP